MVATGVIWRVAKACRRGDWAMLETLVRNEPAIALTPFDLGRYMSTTVLHQAICAKTGHDQNRVLFIETVIELVPAALTIRNGTKTLPLHVITYTDVQINSRAKIEIACKMIDAYPQALLEKGGENGRTPLHSYLKACGSDELVKKMLEAEPTAASMEDEFGLLPIQVACSYSCTIKNLHLLLHINPTSLYAVTPQGESLLEIAKTCPKHRQRKGLIKELNKLLQSGSLQAAALPMCHSPIRARVPADESKEAEVCDLTEDSSVSEDDSNTVESKDSGCRIVGNTVKSDDGHQAIDTVGTIESKDTSRRAVDTRTVGTIESEDAGRRTVVDTVGTIESEDGGRSTIDIVAVPRNSHHHDSPHHPQVEQTMTQDATDSLLATCRTERLAWDKDAAMKELEEQTKAEMERLERDCEEASVERESAKRQCKEAKKHRKMKEKVHEEKRRARKEGMEQLEGRKRAKLEELEQKKPSEVEMAIIMAKLGRAARKTDDPDKKLALMTEFEHWQREYDMMS